MLTSHFLQNITPSPSSVADATDIIALVTTLKPSIQSALVHIVEKKPAFAALPLGNVVALVKGDIVALNASTYAFSTALVASTPVSTFIYYFPAFFQNAGLTLS